MRSAIIRPSCRLSTLLLTLFMLLITMTLIAQPSSEKRYRIAFYNTENLFDCVDDPETEDNDFLPESIRHWNFGRFKKKIAHLAQTIVALGEWDAPALVGLCEVENEYVMDYLTRYSPLKELGYRYFITHSPDARGIDVALLYRRDLFRPLSHDSIRVDATIMEGHKTRDILHVCGELLSGDTLDLFVCHLPSRREGTRISEPRRLGIAEEIRQKIDSITENHPNRKIIVMGDLNDEPFDLSIREGFGAHPMDFPVRKDLLYHPFFRKKGHSSERNSSYKHENHWQLFDQILVSGGLLLPESSIRLNPPHGMIFKGEFLFEEDTKYGGRRPFRTYWGMQYAGGYSDHLPVYIDLKEKSAK